MLAVKDPTADRYYGYFAAMADVKGRGPVGVIAVAESRDLLSWSEQTTVYVPPFAGEIVVTTQPGSYQRYMAHSMTAASMEVELTLCADCRECGVVLATADEQGAAKETYVFSMNTGQQELTVYVDRLFRSEYSLHSKRQYAFEKNRSYHIRVIASEGQFEVYIDDVLALQGCMCTNSTLTPGLFCALGSARFTDTRFYELEE